MKQWNNYTGDDLTLVICAYGRCQYLEEAVGAIYNQTVRSKILISTSTPNDMITGVAEKYGIRICVNPEGGQINDYNFAIRQADTPLVMLAHQDEVLLPEFVERSIFWLNHMKDPIISFTDYIEMHNDVADAKPSKMVRIKEMLLFPMKWRWLAGTKFGKRLCIRFGDPIAHPSVIHVVDKLPDNIFRVEYKASMDWDLWQRLAEEQGSFVYVNEILLKHRMNDENQTAKLIKTTNAREHDEYEIYCRYWPKWFAKLLMHFYGKADRYY